MVHWVRKKHFERNNTHHSSLLHFRPHKNNVKEDVEAVWLWKRLDVFSRFVHLSQAFQKSLSHPIHSFSTTIFRSKWGLNYIPGLDPQSSMIFLKKCVHQPRKSPPIPPHLSPLSFMGSLLHGPEQGSQMTRAQLLGKEVPTPVNENCGFHITWGVDTLRPIFFGCKTEG